MTVHLLWLSVGSQDCLFWVRANVSLVQELKPANTAGLPRIESPTFILSFLESKQTVSLGQLADISRRGVSCRNTILNTCLCPAPPCSKLHWTIHLAYIERAMTYLCKNPCTRVTTSTKYQPHKAQPPELDWIVDHAQFQTDYFFPSQMSSYHLDSVYKGLDLTIR